MNVLLDRVLEGIKGHRVVDLARMTPDVLAGILPRIYPQMLDVVREHQDAGRPVLHRHGRVAAGRRDPGRRRSRWTARSGRAGRCEDGVYTGRLDGPFAYGEGKAEALRRFAAERGIDLEQSWAYTDAASDLPMLEAVGHPVAVNPDAGLAEIARREGWEVLRFEKLGSGCASAAAVRSPRRSAAAGAGSPRAGAARR